MSDSDRLRQILVSASAVGIMAVDDSGVIRSVNPAAAELLARPADQLLGRQLGFPTVADEPREIDVMLPDGAVRTVEMRVSATTWEGRQLYITALHDLTATGEQDDGRASRSAALVIAAQELDAPLAAVAGAVQQFRDTTAHTDVRQAELIDRIDERIEQLRGLVTRLRSAAGDTERLQIAPEPIRVFESLLERLNELREKARNVALRCDAGLTVFVDRDEFADMLDSYLHHAVGDGGSPVDLDVTQQGEWVDIRVCGGVVEEARAGAAGADEYDNAPVGSPLWTTRSLARLYGGDAWYQPSDCGGCFHLRLPATTR